MAYILDSTTIRSPQELTVSNSTQIAQNRTLGGSITRDLFGSNKRIWVLAYSNTKKTDFDTINTIYQSYLSTVSAKTWEITEPNYTVTQTNVHVDLKQREFRVRGTDYISDFDLILTEA